MLAICVAIEKRISVDLHISGFIFYLFLHIQEHDFTRTAPSSIRMESEYTNRAEIGEGLTSMRVCSY